AVAAISPLAARAQQQPAPVIGILNSFSPPPNRTGGPVGQGLSESGYVAGRNVVFEPRWAENHYDRLTGALLDRLTHHVHILEMNGDSYRLKQSRRRQRQPQAAELSDTQTQA